ncbi:hypothetical protein [Pedobacter sp. Leaf194]|uniref:hypothetical protein n=1 Tax=Pedobacter sp. Leaf194 TaxID=1736297 RepID=UPI000702EA81|nr:hypothetical protein [Pedobacter sp. Leaf194]KQS35645.1 hypothetical protein ASG14_09210 [Pedobacter sp. Leaf194]
MVHAFCNNKSIRVLTFILLASAFLTQAFAQNLVGCGKQGGTMIYYQRNGNGSGLNFLLPRYDAPFSTFTANTAICPRFTTVSIYSPATACCIGGTDCTNNILYNFTNIPCPLDDYAPILVLSVGAIGLFAVRRNGKRIVLRVCKQ